MFSTWGNILKYNNILILFSFFSRSILKNAFGVWRSSFLMKLKWKKKTTDETGKKVAFENDVESSPNTHPHLYPRRRH